MRDHQHLITDAERYGTAIGAGRLRQRMEGLAAADVVGAAGFAGASQPLGIALWRAVYGNDRHAYVQAGQLLISATLTMARKRRWQERPKALKSLAVAVLQWSVFGVCPQCAGRGLLPVDGVPNVMSDDPCPGCHGDGATPIERSVPTHQIGRAKDIAQILVDAHDEMYKAMRRQLGRRT